MQRVLFLTGSSPHLLDILAPPRALAMRALMASPFGIRQTVALAGWLVLGTVRPCWGPAAVTTFRCMRSTQPEAASKKP